MKVTDLDMGSKMNPRYVKITEDRPSDGKTSVIIGNARDEETLKIDPNNHRHIIVKDGVVEERKDKGDWR
jgi:hypothetical protein